MTALDHRPPAAAPWPATTRWEWREFEADGWAHLYEVAELTKQRLVLLRPRCLLGVPFALLHDRPSISPDARIPGPGWTCPACAEHGNARIPHPRSGSPVAGRFAGDLAQVVTCDERSTRRPRR